MRKLLLVLIAICFMVPSSFAYDKSDNISDEFFIGLPYDFDKSMECNEQMYYKYVDFIVGKQNDIELSKIGENKIMNEELPDSIKKLLNEDFIALQLINKDMDVKVVDEKQENNVISAIMYDKNNDLYFFIEQNGNQKNFLLYINNYKYIVEMENEDCYLKSKNNEKLYFIKSDSIDVRINQKNVASANASWILMADNLRKTSTAWITVLDVISVMAGGSSFIKGAHPILGIISFITGAASFVGNQILVTFYIVFSQSYRSDCTTYIKEIDDYYQYSDYTGYVGSHTSYFHTVRPDYAGQNCMAYGW